jgi:hypothetical protein
LQVVLSWVNGLGITVRRVVTRKLQTTKVLASYVRDLNVAVAVVLLAKGVIQDAVNSEAAVNDELPAMQRNIGERCCLLASLLCTSTKGSGSQIILYR